jgi:hypothetical protein
MKYFILILTGNIIRFTVKNSFLFIPVLMLCLVSCKKEPDYSYPLEKYMELGIPDINRPWKISEFADIIGDLRHIKNNDPLSLPRKGSRKSGRLFDHMVSMDNLSFLNIDTLPLYEKAYRIQSFLQIHSEYCDIYTDLYKRQQYYHRELIEFYIFGIRVTQEMLHLAQQINESDKPGDVGLQSGFSAIQRIHLNMLAFALDKQKNTSLFSKKDLDKLGDSIALSVRRNMSWFDSTHVEMIKRNMSVVIDSSTSDKIRKEYLDIINTL